MFVLCYSFFFANCVVHSRYCACSVLYFVCWLFFVSVMVSFFALMFIVVFWLFVCLYVFFIYFVLSFFPDYLFTSVFLPLHAHQPFIIQDQSMVQDQQQESLRSLKEKAISKFVFCGLRRKGCWTGQLASLYPPSWRTELSKCVSAQLGTEGSGS